jgi:hypothetical protein
LPEEGGFSEKALKPFLSSWGKNANKLMRITQSHNQISTQYKVFAIKLNWRKSNLMEAKPMEKCEN